VRPWNSRRTTAADDGIIADESEKDDKVKTTSGLAGMIK
jgi:hypothetical protein